MIKTKNIGHNVVIRPYVCIEEDVIIGNNVIIHPHVTIENGVIIKDNVEIFPGAYIGKEPKGAGIAASVSGLIKKVVIGENCSVGPGAVIYYDVEISNNCLIGDHASIRERARIGSYCLIGRCVNINFNVTIGSYTKIMDCTHITGDTTIGSRVFISILVSTTNDNSFGSKEYTAAFGSKGHISNSKGPTIEDGVMIGASAILLPGITLGKNSVVASGSIVTKDVAADKLVMGIPAKEKLKVE